MGRVKVFRASNVRRAKECGPKNAVQAVKEWKLISEQQKKRVIVKRVSCQKDSLLQNRNGGVGGERRADSWGGKGEVQFYPQAF